MDTRFPPSPRVRFKRQPLTEVICQLRHPPRDISEVLASEFHSQIRERFPAHQPVRRESVFTTFGVRDGSLQVHGSGVGPQHVEHVFHAADSRWKVSLAPDFVSLSTQDYTDWVEFRGQLRRVVTVLQGLEPLEQVSRAGLRYINAIRRRELGLESEAWTTLLRPSMLGLAAEAELANTRPLEMVQTMVFPLGETDRMRINHGLVLAGEPDEHYVIDTDSFTMGKLDVDEALTRLERYRLEMGYFFRWVLSERLRGALEPEMLEVQEVQEVQGG